MITQGQATLLGSYIHSYIGLLLVGSVAFMFALLIWQAAFDQNPLTNAMSKMLYNQQAQVQQYLN